MYYMRLNDAAKPITKWEYKAAVLRGSRVIHALQGMTLISEPHKTQRNQALTEAS